jgi:hypothetical protein
MNTIKSLARTLAKEISYLADSKSGKAGGIRKNDLPVFIEDHYNERHGIDHFLKE